MRNFLSVSLIFSVQGRIFSLNMRYIFIYVARWGENYLSKRSLIKPASDVLYMSTAWIFHFSSRNKRKLFKQMFMTKYFSWQFVSFFICRWGYKSLNEELCGRNCGLHYCSALCGVTGIFVLEKMCKLNLC